MITKHANSCGKSNNLNAIKDRIRTIYLKGEGIRACKAITRLAAKEAAEVVKNSPSGNRIAFIFVGSSGRGEMCLQSDMDYLILYDRPACPEGIAQLQRDIAAKLQKNGFGKLSCFGVGPSAYFIAGSKFSLLDRLVLDDIWFVAGDQKIYDDFSRKIQSSFSTSPTEIEDTLINMLFIYCRFRRYARFDSANPDIKKGRGGIRDLQFLLQLAKIKYDASGRGTPECIDTLLQNGVISRPDANKLKEATDFLYAVRNELHYKFASAKDILDQSGLAAVCRAFGLSPEQVLETYRLHAKNIYDLTRAIKRRLRSAIDESRGKEWANRLKQAENPDTPQRTQIELARAEDKVMRLAIAWNSTNEPVLREVMKKERKNKKAGRGYDWNILFALAHSPFSPTDVYHWLLNLDESGNPYRKIPWEVINNPKVVKMISGPAYDSSLKETVERALSKNKK